MQLFCILTDNIFLPPPNLQISESKQKQKLAKFIKNCITFCQKGIQVWGIETQSNNISVNARYGTDVCILFPDIAHQNVAFRRFERQKATLLLFPPWLIGSKPDRG